MWGIVIGLLMMFAAPILFLYALRQEKKERASTIEELKKLLKSGRQVEVDLSFLASELWNKKTETISTQEKAFQEETSKDTSSDSFSRDETKQFFNQHIEPIAEKLRQNGTLELVIKILSFLDEKGDIPSVVMEPKTDSSISYEMLRSITLLQHSLDTAIFGMKFVKEEFPFYYDVMPDKYLVLFLGHDIGKALVEEDTFYTMQDHPLLSVKVLSGMIPDEISWKADVLEAVKNHHMSVDLKKGGEANDVTILQIADRKAREFEIQQSAHKIDEQTCSDREASQTDISEQAGISGISVRDVLSRVLRLVNKSITKEDLQNKELPIPPSTHEGNFLALSQPDGIVYVRPDVLYHAFVQAVKEKKAEKQNAFILAKEKNEALVDIVSWLMKNKVIPEGHIKEGYIGRWYSVSLGEGKAASVLFTPISVYSFDDVMPRDLEKIRMSNERLKHIQISKKISKKE